MNTSEDFILAYDLYDFRAEGGRALERLQRLGWVPSDLGVARVSPRSFRLYGDAVGDRQVSIARIWETAAYLRRCPVGGEDGPPAALFIIQLEGVARCRTLAPTRELILRPRECVLLPDTEGTQYGSSGATARIEFRVPEGYVPSAVEGIVLGPSSYVDVAVNFANTLLSGQVSPADGEFSYIARATREILRAVARTEMKDPSPHRPRLRTLYDAAQRIIESRYSDPRFSVTALAAELHVSERYLRYAYSEFETSPAAMLRARRVESAREALAQLGSSPNDATGFARSHGFSSARALRIALARDSLGMREAE